MLGLNIDHIATLRQARGIHQPDPLEAIFIAKNALTQQITLHLREDRRHIHESDLARIIASSPLPINVECASDVSKGGVVEILCAMRPHKITLVPEKREEITTEGGLNLRAPNVATAINIFKQSALPVAVFIEPDIASITLAKELGIASIELHTGAYANAYDLAYSCFLHSHNVKTPLERDKALQHAEKERKRLESAAIFANSIGLDVCAGHGLNYENIAPIATLPYVRELNIGHSIIARAVMVGLYQAIKDMQAAIAFAMQHH